MTLGIHLTGHPSGGGGGVVGKLGTNPLVDLVVLDLGFFLFFFKVENWLGSSTKHTFCLNKAYLTIS